MAHQLRALAVKQDLSLVPRTYFKGLKPTVTPAPGASTPSSGLFGYLHTCTQAPTQTYTFKYKLNQP